MKNLKFLLSLFIFFIIAHSVDAQSNTLKPTSTDTISNPAKTIREREAEEKLAKATASMERSAEKLKVLIEEKADKIARKSKPYIENLLVAASELIEKMTDELAKATEEKPAKKQ